MTKGVKKYYRASTGLHGYNPNASKKFATVKGAWNHVIKEFQRCWGKSSQELVFLYCIEDVEFIHSKQSFPTGVYGHENYEPFTNSRAVCCGMSHLDYDGKKWKWEDD
jgi:hypothetical protein